MKTHIPVSLNVIRIDQPCPASWEAMSGNARVRFCDECRLHVYNLSELTRPEAEALIVEHEGHVCVRYYQRADGTIITRDCEGGLRRAMQRTHRLVVAVAGMMLCAMLAPFAWGSSTKGKRIIENIDASVQQMMGRQAPPVALMGDIAPLPRPSTQATTEPTSPTTCPSE